MRGICPLFQLLFTISNVKPLQILADIKSSSDTGALTDTSSAIAADAIFIEDNLRRANFAGANLSGADLTNTSLQDSIIIGITYQVGFLQCEDADFEDALIDDEGLSNQLSERKAKNVPAALKSRKELMDELQRRGVSSSIIENVLHRTSLH